MFLAAELAHHRAEDTGADRLLVLVDQHGGVRIEADHRAIGAANVLRRTHNDGTVHVALLHAPTGGCFLDADDDDVADARCTALGPAKHLDALHPLRAAVVSDLDIGL